MRIDILTVVPELLASPLNESILKRAQEKGLVEIHIHNIRDYTEDKHRTTDDYPFGGEAGMVMKIEPIYRCIEALKAEREYDVRKTWVTHIIVRHPFCRYFFLCYFQHIQPVGLPCDRM